MPDAFATAHMRSLTPPSIPRLVVTGTDADAVPRDVPLSALSAGTDGTMMTAHSSVASPIWLISPGKSCETLPMTPSMQAPNYPSPMYAANPSTEAFAKQHEVLYRGDAGRGCCATCGGSQFCLCIADFCADCCDCCPSSLSDCCCVACIYTTIAGCFSACFGIAGRR